MNIVAKQATWKELFSGQNGLKAIALAAGVILHATDVFLATTIMPSVIDDIGGLAFYSWATTAYVVAAILGSVLSSRNLLKNGPRTSYRGAIFLFTSGALLCAIAPYMYVFLIGRFIQGIGGGLLFALSYAMVNEVFEKRFWPRAMALISAMWGVATFIGPFIGGVFAEYSHWRMAFVTLAVIAMSLLFLTERILPKKLAVIDEKASLPWMQLMLITLAALTVSGGAASQHIILNVGSILIAGILLFWTVKLDKKANNRLLPCGSYDLTKTLGATYLVIALINSSTAVEIYIPYFFRVIHQYSPLLAGYLTVLIAVGWTTASILFSGISLNKVRVSILMGLSCLFIGICGLSLIMPSQDLSHTVFFILISICLLMIGMGIGIGWPHLLTRVLTFAPKDEGEKASASITTVQLLSTAIATAFAGLVVNLTGLIEPGGLAGTQNAATWLFGIFALAPFTTFFLLLFTWKSKKRIGKR